MVLGFGESPVLSLVQESPRVGRETTQILPLPTGQALSQHVCPMDNNYMYIYIYICSDCPMDTCIGKVLDP